MIDQVLRLLRAHGDGVEGDIVVDGLGIADETVIGDDAHTGVASQLGGGRGGCAVVRADDEHLNALGDQALDVGSLGGRVALAEQDLDLIAGGFQRFAESGFVLYPAGFITGRQDDAHPAAGPFFGRRFFFCGRFLGRGFFFGRRLRRGLPATGYQGQHRQNGDQAQQHGPLALLHCEFLLLDCLASLTNNLSIIFLC